MPNIWQNLILGAPYGKRYENTDDNQSHVWLPRLDGIRTFYMNLFDIPPIYITHKSKNHPIQGNINFCHSCGDQKIQIPMLSDL